MENKLKLLLKKALNLLWPSGISIRVPKLDLIFKVQSQFLGYRKFGNAHNALWEQCLAETKGKVFFDIGAHIGLYAIPATQIAKKVVAFEPSDANFGKLKANLALNNNPTNIKLENVVLSNISGEIDFFQDSDASNPKNSILSQSSNQLTKTKKMAVSLDDYVQKNSCYPEVLKIDVEGAEFLVLNGAKHTLMTHRPSVYLSLHPRLIKELSFEMSWLGDFAKEIRYSIFPENFANTEALNEVILHPIR